MTGWGGGQWSKGSPNSTTIRAGVWSCVQIGGPANPGSAMDAHPLLFESPFRSVFDISLVRTWSHGHTSLHCQLGRPPQRRGLSLRGRERIVQAATSCLGHYRLTSFFVSHFAVIWYHGHILKLSVFIPKISIKVPLAYYSSINLSIQNLLDSHNIRLYCSLLIFPQTQLLQFLSGIF